MQTSQKCHGLLRISHYLTLKCHNPVTFQNGHPFGWPFVLMITGLLGYTQTLYHCFLRHLVVADKRHKSGNENQRDGAKDYREQGKMPRSEERRVGKECRL